MTRQPEKTFRIGGVAASIWQNDGKDKDGNDTTYHTVSIERSYKNKQDEWARTSSFRSSDLPKVEVVTRKAFEYLNLKEDYSKKENEEAITNEEEAVE